MSEEKAAGGVNTGRIISILVGVALVAALGFFIYKYYNEKSKNETQELNIEGLTAEIEDLETDLDDYKLELENQDLDLEEKERLLAEKEQLLVEKQKKIDELARSNKISRAQAETLKGKVEQLEYYIKKYQKEIDVLREELDAEKARGDSLSGQVTDLSGKVRDYKRKTEATEFKLETAAILNAHSFEYFRIKGSGKEVPNTSFRRGQMDKFKVCLKINQNLAAERGDRDFYMQIKSPSGKVIKDDLNGQSGFFKYLDEDQVYTAKKTANYDRETMSLCIQFNKPDNYDYEKGKHSVIVFADGFDIGTGSFTVK